MILVDTSVWIDYFNGMENRQTAILDTALSDNTVLTGDIILVEVLQGFDRESHFRQAKEALLALECVQLANRELAVSAATNFRFLRSKGTTIRKTVDMIIGTWCLESGVPLLHSDKDFDRMARLLPLEIVTNM